MSTMARCRFSGRVSNFRSGGIHRGRTPGEWVWGVVVTMGRLPSQDARAILRQFHGLPAGLLASKRISWLYVIVERQACARQALVLRPGIPQLLFSRLPLAFLGGAAVQPLGNGPPPEVPGGPPVCALAPGCRRSGQPVLEVALASWHPSPALLNSFRHARRFGGTSSPAAGPPPGPGAAGPTPSVRRPCPVASPPGVPFAGSPRGPPHSRPDPGAAPLKPWRGGWRHPDSGRDGHTPSSGCSRPGSRRGPPTPPAT